MKRSFFNRQSAAVTLLHAPETVAEAVAVARNAEMDGADAVALELHRMPREERSVENFQQVIRSVQLPFMFIDYRYDVAFGSDDDARQESLMMAVDAGAEVVDVIGDLYDPSPRELTVNPEAIEKQKALIARIHERGGKALMSSHMPTEALKAEEVLAHLQEQSSRGADILKIVVKVDSEEECVEAVRTMLLLHRSLNKPYIYLASGRFSRFIRYIGPKFGVAVEFGVHDYSERSSYFQPTIKSFQNVLQNMHWDIENG